MAGPLEHIDTEEMARWALNEPTMTSDGDQSIHAHKTWLVHPRIQKQGGAPYQQQAWDLDRVLGCCLFFLSFRKFLKFKLLPCREISLSLGDRLTKVLLGVLLRFSTTKTLCCSHCCTQPPKKRLYLGSSLVSGSLRLKKIILWRNKRTKVRGYK